MRVRASIATLLLAGLLAGFPLAGQEPEPPPDAPVETAAVEVDGVPLFRVRGVTSYPAGRRAADVSERIARLAADPGVAPESLTVADSELGSQILSGAERVLVITDADAELEGVGREQLAFVTSRRIQEAIRAYRSERSRDFVLDASRRVLIAAAAFLVTVVLLVWLSRRFRVWLEHRFRRRMQALAIGSFELVRADRAWSYLRGLIGVLRALLLFAVAFFFLDYALRQFPWTRAAGHRLDDWIIGPLATLGRGFAASIPDLIFLAILFLLTRWALQLVRLFFEAVGRGEVELSGFDAEWAAPTYKLVRVAIVAFAVIVAYPYIPGSDSAAFKGVSIFLGVVFSLGSSSAIANIIAGYTMTYRRAFKEGDRVKIGDAVGVVTQVRLQVTHLRTIKNEEVVIPNSSILGSEVINYSTLAKGDGLILHTTVGIGYETPWRQVEAMLLLAAERTGGLMRDRAAFVRQLSLGDFAVVYELNVHTDEPTRAPALYTELHRNILDVFNEFGVQIMTPAYEGDPERPKVVPRDEWWTSPAAPAPAPTRGPG